jgi:parallel beta-helix repeat protein
MVAGGKMNNKLFKPIFVAILLLTNFSITVLVSAENVTIKTSTITVPDDYLTIQQAITAANPGDTIYVREGTYYGYIDIWKPLTLQGEDKHNTIIDGQGTDWIIDIDGIWNVTFTGFTVKNSSRGLGISLEKQEGAIIENNIIKNTACGIEVYICNNTIIKNNIIQNNKCGIALENTSNISISNNVFKRNMISAVFEDSKDNTWNDNYWNRPRLLPKLIIGRFLISESKLFVPWFNIDRSPEIIPPVK